MAYADRQAAWRTMLIATRRYSGLITSTMAGVAENTISANDITNINASIDALVSAIQDANAGLMARDES